LKLGQSVTAIDPDARRLTLADGEVIAFDKLLIAGARARHYPLLDALGDKAHVLRTARDAARLRPELQPGRRLLVVGAGYRAGGGGHRHAAWPAVTVLERAPPAFARHARAAGPHPAGRARRMGWRCIGVDLVAAEREGQASPSPPMGGALRRSVVYGIGVR
jgi:3-phenylpropionate/trans-cinnamate dioxygenase ferredoxin reductase subunit